MDLFVELLSTLFSKSSFMTNQLPHPWFDPIFFNFDFKFTEINSLFN